MAAVAEEATLARRLRRWEGLPYWLILPTLAYLAVFFAWPMTKSFQLAFQVDGDWTIEPFRRMKDDVAFGEAFRFTLLLIVFIIPIQFVLALLMALLVNAQLRLRGAFLYVFLLPLAISDLAAGIVWSSMFTELGYLNTVLEARVDRPAVHLDQLPEGEPAAAGDRGGRDLAVDRARKIIWSRACRIPRLHRGGRGLPGAASSSASAT